MCIRTCLFTSLFMNIMFTKRTVYTHCILKTQRTHNHIVFLQGHTANSFLFIPGMAFIVQSYGNHDRASTAMLFTYKFSGSLPLLTASLSKVVFQKTCKKIPCRKVHDRFHLLST